MFFQDDSGDDFRLLTAALKALADIPNPDGEWVKRHLKIYAHAQQVAEEDARQHAKGWKGSNGIYSRPHRTGN